MFVVETVGRFDVSMDDADGLRCFEAFNDFQNEIDGVPRRQSAAEPQLILQRASRQQLHRNNRMPLDLLRTEDENRAGMVDRGRQSPLAHETGTV